MYWSSFSQLFCGSPFITKDIHIGHGYIRCSDKPVFIFTRGTCFSDSIIENDRVHKRFRNAVSLIHIRKNKILLFIREILFLCIYQHILFLNDLGPRRIKVCNKKSNIVGVYNEKHLFSIRLNVNYWLFANENDSSRGTICRRVPGLESSWIVMVFVVRIGLSL